jgi:hypothetical protein
MSHPVVSYNIVWGRRISSNTLGVLAENLGLCRTKYDSDYAYMMEIDHILSRDYDMNLWFGSDVYGKAVERTVDDVMLVLGYVIINQGERYHFTTQKLQRMLGDIVEVDTMNKVLEKANIDESCAHFRYYFLVDHRDEGDWV